MFICIWIWYFVLYWVGNSPGWFAFAFLCFSTSDFAHVTLYHASFTLTNHMLEPCHTLPLSLREAWLGWRQAFVRQGTTTIVCRRVRHTLAYLFCLLCVLLTQSKCNVSYWYKGFRVQQHNVLAHLQVQAALPLWSCPQQHVEQYDIIRYKRLLRLHIWVVFSSDTTGLSHPHISLCLTTTQCIVLVYTINATVTSKCSFSIVNWSSYMLQYKWVQRNSYCDLSV